MSCQARKTSHVTCSLIVFVLLLWACCLSFALLSWVLLALLAFITQTNNVFPTWKHFMYIDITSYSLVTYIEDFKWKNSKRFFKTFIFGISSKPHNNSHINFGHHKISFISQFSPISWNNNFVNSYVIMVQFVIYIFDVIFWANHSGYVFGSIWCFPMFI